jgi:aspartyl-tRNA(Asn)/glutamyl-tRNA(Gln) amidotransferase subunit B
MSEYFTTIGLEVHAELRTETKMFCNSKNDTEEKRPNVNVCPVCLGYPGTLPVINKEAVRQVLRFGTAVNGELADYTEFDRKNYFYPDIPKGYQISQYKYPLVKGGELSGVKLTRVHLEEDTAKSTHDAGDFSLVDFNRAGVPLMELVTEPVIKSAEEAASFARELQLLLIYLGASHANLEKGEMRVEANISVSKDPNKFGTKVEVKNLNSFKAVEKAIRYEVTRHQALLDRGESVAQETRGWDEKKESTFSQRAKEDSHDYRYFPDPDLPKLKISEIEEFSHASLSKTLPEMPWARRERYVKDFGIKIEDAEIYVRNLELGTYFEKVARVLGNKELNQMASNYINSDLKILISESSLAEVIVMTSKGELSSRGAKDILKIIQSEGGEPKAIAEKNNLYQTSNEGELESTVVKIIAEQTKAVDEYKKGNAGSIQYLIGQAMKETKGSANPVKLKDIFERLLK